MKLNKIQKLLINLLVVLVLMFFLAKETRSDWEGWEKYPENPIFTGTQSWDSAHVSAPFVLYEEGAYKIWFSGHDGSRWRIGFAQSSDGINWTEHVSNPVLDIDSSIGEREVAEPSVLHDGSVYKMWYTSVTTGFSIRYAFSEDGLTWTRDSGAVIQTGSGWENEIVATPFVLKIDGVYKMWYSGRSGGRWQIGYAESDDSVNWRKHPSNPVIRPDVPWDYNSVVRPAVFFDGQKYHMFYQAGPEVPYVINYAESLDGITWSKPEDKNHVLRRGSSGSFDSVYISAPYPLKDGDRWRLWYVGYDGSRFSVGYAANEEVVTPTPTANRIPIILLPGMLGSWSAEGILEKKDVPYDAWKMTPFVHEYDGLIQTLKNAGYQDSGDNQDLFVFNYDWRKNLDSSADTLKQFLEEKVFPKTGDKKVNLVGHSLGGLVARSYLQKYEGGGDGGGGEGIDKLITVGSPHKGALPAYKAWEGGEIEAEDSLSWLAQKFILKIYKNGLETDRETLQTNGPVIKDLLPTFNFLKVKHPETEEIIEIPLEMMTIKNDYLLELNSDFSDFFEIFQAIIGQIGQTEVPEWYKVEGPSILDEILGNWVDGRPVGTEYGSGDKVILEKSAKYDPDPAEVLSLEHGELIYKKMGLISLLSLMGVEVEEGQIVEGQATKVTPSLIIALLSPARFRAVCTQGTFESGEDKILLLPEVNLQDCQIEVIGEGEGEYELIIGQIGPMGQISEEKWLKVEEETDEGEIDVYDFTDGSQLVPLEQAKRLIDKLLAREPANRYLLRAKFYLELEDDHEGRNYISAIENLLIFRRQITDSEMLTLSKEAIEKLVRAVRELGVVRDRREGKIAEIVLSGRLQRVTEDLSRNKALSLDWGRNLLEEVKEKQEFILGLVVKQLSN